MRPPIIKAKNFSLRPFRLNDSAALVHHLRLKAIHRYTLNMPYPYTEADARKWLTKQQTSLRLKTDGSLTWAIDIAGQVVGRLICAILVRGTRQLLVIGWPESIGARVL